MNSLNRIMATLLLSLPMYTYAHDVSVDCDAGDSLADAVNAAEANTSIFVHGFCNEVILIEKDGISIDGSGHDGSGHATISGAGIFTSTDVIRVDGVQRVTLKGVTVQDGIFGIALQNAASVALLDVHVINNKVMGIMVTDNSNLNMTGVDIDQNGVNGLEVTGNSHVTVNGELNVIDNTVFGIDVINSSSITFKKSITHVHGNIVGMQVGITSSGFIEDSETVLDTSDNGSIGLTVVSTSSFFVFAGSIISNNNARNDGVSMFSNSSIDLDRTASLVATNNGRDGILLENSLLNTVQMPGDAPSVRLEGNSRNGMSVIQNGSVDFVGDSTLTATNNGEGGVLVDNGSSARLVNATLDQNGDHRDVVLTFGGRADISNSNISSIVCDGTHLLRGDTKKCKKEHEEDDD